MARYGMALTKIYDMYRTHRLAWKHYLQYVCPHGVVMGCQRRRKQREQSKSSAFTASGSMSRSFCKEKNYCLLLWRKYFTVYSVDPIKKIQKVETPACVWVILVPSMMTLSILSRTPQSRWFFEISIFLLDFSLRIVIVESSSLSLSLSVSWSPCEGGFRCPVTNYNLPYILLNPIS